jgi:hypothetical protein
MHPLDAVSDSVLNPRDHRAVMLNTGRLVGHVERAGYSLRVGHDLAETAPIFGLSNAPLAVMADPAVHAGMPETTLTVTLWKDGEPQGCAAIRRVWVDFLPTDLETLRYWYGEQTPPEGVRCSIPDADWLAEIYSCWTAWSCSFHIHREAQKARGVTEALIRIAHALSLTKWDWRWLLGRGKSGVIARFPFEVYGANHVSPGLFLLDRDEQPDADHPHFLMGVRRASFTAQAAHAYYGDPLQKIGIPPALRPKTEES